MNKLIIIKLILLYLSLSTGILAQQINLVRIDRMPDYPSPYLMRDWKTVALGYDTLVFNQNLTGDYLPLIFFRNSTVNYPGDISFGLHTVVGTKHPTSGEAINVLPAVISASLVGVDKSNQNGYNWVKMCREYFNNRPEQNVYKNHPVDNTFDDWWYITMPNVFFYQLYDLYPNTIDFNYQLRMVADQWLKAVEKMGGNTTPWNIPNMNYRGWDFSTMTPYPSGVLQPEASGAIAWLLYNAYKETDEVKYRVGSELAMEFFDGLTSNPSYELQLVYGAYTAAKMNAELGTKYNIEKILNWCFDVGPLRKWGSILGTWDGVDVSGLIGEVNGVNDYAFSMNTFEQIGALVPLIRYDERFANAIGKWTLNAANASRLFYTNYMPSFKQDSEEWAYEYDKKSYLAHEGLRKKSLTASWSPYATGDAILGGWGSTNLTLYSSSHAGILGGIIDTTNIEGILKLDLTKTDYFNETSYPSFLFYNPFPEDKIVNLNLGSSSTDIYEAITNSFLFSSVCGVVQLSIPAKNSIVVTLTPSGSSGEYSYNKFLVNGIVVDYNAGLSLSNIPPRIKAFSAAKNIATTGEAVSVFCTAVDSDLDPITYTWNINGGSINGEGKNISWQLPSILGEYEISVITSDNKGGLDSANIKVSVVESINIDPQINNIIGEPRKINIGSSTVITCNATDADSDELTYVWESIYGNIAGEGQSIVWTAPNVMGNYYVSCRVSDGKGGVVSDSISISVRDLTNLQTGELICFYSFNGTVADESGNNNNGILSGASFTSDRFGNTNSALRFDGIDDNVRVLNNSILNFTKAISLNFWMNTNSFFDREQYVISHGNWERRWKISISNNRLRWTIKTLTGITDLDSETLLKDNTLYNVTVVYSGTEMEIYLNNKLDAFKYWSGNLLTTDIDLTIAQTVPGNSNYNFNGILDDIRIYDYALSLEEIDVLYDFSTEVKSENIEEITSKFHLYQNYPNPFNGQTNINYSVKSSSKVSVTIYDMLGRRIIDIVDEYKNPGTYSVVWNSKDSKGIQLASGIYFLRLKANNILDTKKIILLQ